MLSDRTPMRYQGMTAGLIELVTESTRQQNTFDYYIDTIGAAYITERKRSSGTLNAMGDRLCQGLKGEGNYIMRAICRIAFRDAVDSPTPKRMKIRERIVLYV